MVKFKVAHHARQLVRQFAVLRLDLLHKLVNGLFVGSGSGLVQRVPPFEGQRCRRCCRCLSNSLFQIGIFIEESGAQVFFQCADNIFVPKRLAHKLVAAGGQDFLPILFEGAGRQRNDFGLLSLWGCFNLPRCFVAVQHRQAKFFNAQCSGNVQAKAKSVDINEVIKIVSDIDYDLGNIEAGKDVHITGTVRSGFAVRYAPAAASPSAAR